MNSRPKRIMERETESLVTNLLNGSHITDNDEFDGEGQLVVDPSITTTSRSASIFGYQQNGNISSNDNENNNNNEHENNMMYIIKNKSTIEIIAILSTSFAYGCIMTTLFIITLPVECERIQNEHPHTIQKSVALGCFVSIAGITQLISPIIGRLSDTYKPPNNSEGQNNNNNNNIGQRLPYLIFGSILTIFGLIGQAISSYWSIWIRYGISFFSHMIGLNIIYAIMISLIPDQIPSEQTGIANGILALLIVLGSLFGFTLFHSVLNESVWDMYGLYTSVVIVTTILTCTYAYDDDVKISQYKQQQRLNNNNMNNNNMTNSDSINSFFTNSEIDVDNDNEEEEGDINNNNNDNDNDNNNTTETIDLTTPLTSTPRTQRRRHRRRRTRIVIKQTTETIIYPMVLLKSILIDPLRKMKWEEFINSYTIDTNKYHDFFIVTISRTFYYMGISVQTFFLYYLHDIINIHDDPEAAVATLAILGNIAGSITCYPVGWLSDKCMKSRRRPFVYLACMLLATSDILLIFCRTYIDTMIVGLLLGASNGIYLTMDTSLAVDTLPHNNNNNNNSSIDDEIQDDEQDQQELTNNATTIGGAVASSSHDDVDDNDDDDDDDTGHAQLLGIWGVAGFIGSALGPLIGGPMLYVFGKITYNENNDNNDDNDDNDKQGYSLRGYSVVLSLSAFYFFCSAISLQFVKKRNV